jgi:uncharacterized glyoxalase superfamily protein PhnB
MEPQRFQVPVADCESMGTFYRQAFGARELHRSCDASGRATVVRIAVGQLVLSLVADIDGETPKRAPSAPAAYCSDLENALLNILASGCSFEVTFGETGDVRCIFVQDPVGLRWRLCPTRNEAD